jgi:glycosyltransferase involved in cell wall biosynthesis
MFCSTVIPTIGRSELSRAVCSVLDQTFTGDDFEVIVVNDSGRPLPAADWQRSERVRVISTNRRERCVARNTGAAIANGKYLHFLDDDDWLLPGALESFWRLAQTCDAAWLYGGARLVDVQSEKQVTLHLGLKGNCFIQAMSGEWIPIQASLVEAEKFFAVGGFSPPLFAGQDKDLCRRITLLYDLAYTPATVAAILRGGESTTNYSLAEKLGRREREKFLSETGAFARMLASASTAYWHGRVVRTYLASTLWNLQHRRPVTAASRAVFGLTGLVLGGWHLLKSDFWQAVTKPHMSRIVQEE